MLHNVRAENSPQFQEAKALYKLGMSGTIGFDEWWDKMQELEEELRTEFPDWEGWRFTELERD